MMTKLYLLIDCRKTFYSMVCRDGTTRKTMEIPKLVELFRAKGIELVPLEYSKLDWSRNWKGEYFLYQSAEDQGTLYKGYFDDILYTLRLQGARLIPEYQFFKAHHNKVFMELLRYVSGSPEICSVRSKVYGTMEEFLSDDGIQYPCVIKGCQGSGSRNVALAHDRSEAIRIVRRVAGPFHWKDLLIGIVFKLKGKQLLPWPVYRNKFIIQPFIPGCSGDYKVLVFSNKYYVLQRQNRPHDFRASGSGILNWPEKVDERLLSFAKKCFDAFPVPYASLDIAFDGKEFFLIEMQFLSFGPLTLTGSSWYWTPGENGWSKVVANSDYHEELVNSVSDFLVREGGELKLPR